MKYKYSKCEICKRLKCRHLYNEEFCLCSNEYVEDLTVSECGVSFEKSKSKNRDYQYYIDSEE